MTDKEMLRALAALPEAEMLAESNITDELGSDVFYSARTVLALLEKERQKCSDLCDDVAEECNNWDEGGQDGKAAAMLCASRIRNR